MKVTYKPEGSEVQEWNYNHGKVRATEAIMCQKRLAPGTSWLEYRMQILKEDALARKVLLWHLNRRDHPTYRWEDVPDFLMDEMEVELSREEWETTRAEIEKTPDSEQKEQALVAIEAMLENLSGDAEGKAK